MRSFTTLLAIVTVALVLGSVEMDGGASCKTMAKCVKSRFGWGILTSSGVPCAISKMLWQCLKMRYVNCNFCDKYFHCQANYDAVHLCSGADAKKAAIAISECREISQTGTDSPDGAADMRATAYGCNGGNCYARYGCAKSCDYKPSDQSCKNSNC